MSQWRTITIDSFDYVLLILQQPNDICLREAFQESHGRSMRRRTLAEIVEFVIIVEEKLPMRRKNMVKYRQNDSNNDEFDDFDKKIVVL
jgi:hypothetical protein